MSKRHAAHRDIARFLVIMLAFGLPGSVVKASTLSVSDGWYRLMPPGSERSAGYLQLENRGPGDSVIVAVRSPQLDKVEIHSHSMKDGVMRMRKLDRFDVPAGEQRAFRPGGYHLMLFGLPPGLVEGASLDFELLLEDGAVVPFTAVARKP